LKKKENDKATVKFLGTVFYLFSLVILKILLTTQAEGFFVLFSTGPQDVDGNSTRGSKKGLFQGKLCLGKTRRRRNSVGTMSSVSDSFRTVTPLNSDEEGAAGFADESFDEGSLPSSIKTSTPKKGNKLMNKGKNNSWKLKH